MDDVSIKSSMKPQLTTIYDYGPLVGSETVERIAKRAEQLRDLWARHPVLLFRRQALSEPELADFSALFGPIMVAFLLNQIAGQEKAAVAMISGSSPHSSVTTPTTTTTVCATFE